MDPLFIGGLIAAAAAGAAVVWGRLKKVKVPRDGVWAKPPQIQFEPAVDRHDLVKATSWWTVLGHRMVVESFPVAEGRQVYDGEIRIVIDPTEVDKRRPPVVEDGEILGTGHGFTEKVVKDGKVLRATIYLYENNALTLAHELGHALGYGHPKNAPTGHMMASGGRTGWDDHRGLEA